MDDNRINEWYSQSSANDWYSTEAAPIKSSPSAAEPKKSPKKPRRKRTGLKVTMIIVLVLFLIAGSAYIFSDGIEILRDYVLSIQGTENESPREDAELVPSVPDISDLPDIFNDLIPGFGDLIPEFDGDFEVIIPDDEDSSQSEIPDYSDFPDDFRDFFDNYYTIEESIASSNLPRAQLDDDTALQLHSVKNEQILSLQQLYSRCSPSVVGVMANYNNTLGYGWGSGIIMDASGYIITNAHVISNADSCTVILSNGRECPALLVGEDSQTDIAVLKIDAKGLVPAVFGDSDEISVGDNVVAIGNPLGAEFSGTLTNGIVSAINRSVDYSGTSMTLIQTNAAINEGNSGGPLFNMYGQVIGITNMKMSNDYGVTIEGIGFAIPSTTVKKVADQLIANGKVLGRPGIGITCGSVPPEAMEEYGLPEGLYITDVSEGSDAKAKGILPGDVLTHINGQQVLTTDDVLSIRDEHQVGDVLRFTIFRDGKTFELDVEIYDLGNIY